MKAMRTLLSLMLVLMLGVSAEAQRKLDPFDDGRTPEQHRRDSILRRFVPGGGANFQVNQGVTFLTISPALGYRFTENFLAGVGGTYTLYRYKYEVTGRTEIFKQTFYGPRLFAQHTIYRGLYGHGEVEALNYEGYDPSAPFGQEAQRQWQQNAFAGLGLRQPLGPTTFNIAVLYNVTYRQKDQIYPSPLVLRFGIGI